MTRNKKPKQSTMGPHEMAYFDETLECMSKGVKSIGVGNYLLERTGMDRKTLSDLILTAATALCKVGAYIQRMRILKDGEYDTIIYYLRIRERLIDAGLRQDFEDLGWGLLCDKLDELKNENPHQKPD